MKIFDASVSTFVGLTVFILYVLVMISIRTKRLKTQWTIVAPNETAAATATAQQRQQEKQAKTEKRIFFQGFIITVVMLSTVLLSYSIYLIPFQIHVILSMITEGIFYGINPFLYVTFSANIRRMVFPCSFKRTAPINISTLSEKNNKNSIHLSILSEKNNKNDQFIENISSKTDNNGNDTVTSV